MRDEDTSRKVCPYFCAGVAGLSRFTIGDKAAEIMADAKQASSFAGPATEEPLG